MSTRQLKLRAEIKKITAMVLLFLLCGGVSAAFSDANILRRLDLPLLDRESVLATLNSYRKDMESVGENSLPFGYYRSYARNVERWLAYKYIEADTGITADWFKRVHRLLQFMAQSRNYLNVQNNLGNTDTPEYRQTEENLRKARLMFADLLRRPEEVETPKLNRLKQEKRAWLEQVRQQLRSKDN